LVRKITFENARQRRALAEQAANLRRVAGVGLGFQPGGHGAMGVGA
jgi:hypothetical protein